MAQPLVALSINEMPSFAWLARRCVESLRSSGSDLDVVVFVSRDTALELSHLPKVEVRTVRTDRHANPFLERWYRVSSLNVQRLIYLDADTICLQPPELLFEKYSVSDIYARREAGTQRPHEATVNERFPAQVDWEAFEGRHESDRRIAPVMNAGVMLFNHGASRGMIDVLKPLCEIHDAWAKHRVPYPSTNDRIMDELALAVALTRSGNPTLGLLAPEDAPFYAEMGTGDSSAGIVLHVWSGLYRAYLQEFGGGRLVAEYDYQRRCDALHQIRTRRRRRPAQSPACL